MFDLHHLYFTCAMIAINVSKMKLFEGLTPMVTMMLDLHVLSSPQEYYLWLLNAKLLQ